MKKRQLFLSVFCLAFIGQAVFAIQVTKIEVNNGREFCQVMYNEETGIFSDNFFDLLPGESHEITFRDNSQVKADRVLPSLTEVNSGLTCKCRYDL